MKINFLTAELSSESGGLIYDTNFYHILSEVFTDVHLYDNEYFVKRYKKGSGTLSFFTYYRKAFDELFDCDVLIMSSRHYSRFALCPVKRKLRNKRAKLIVIHHHSNYMFYSGIMRIVHKYLESRFIRGADELIISDPYVIDQIRRDFGELNIIHLPSSFDKKTKFSLSKLESRILLFVGNVEPRKGIIYGLRAFREISRRHPEYEYHIAGRYDEKGDYYKTLQSFVRDNALEDKVFFEGRVDDSRIDWLYSNAELFLFPSLLEGFGWVIEEAMARGLPVVAFNNSAMPYTVKDGYNGLLIEDRNTSSMAERVSSLLDDRNEMKKLQQGALETYTRAPDRDDLNRMTREYLEKLKSSSAVQALSGERK